MEQQDRLRFVNDVEAAKILSVSPQSLRNWRHMGRGPSYTKRGRMVRYQIQNLLSYMEQGRIDPEIRDVAGT
jgi:predicted site-specific integrase-resolvase